MKVKILGTIEARMGSTRLVGKTLTDVRTGLPLLELVYKRFKNCKSVDEVCVATSISNKDDAIAHFCEERGIKYFRGSEDDVLARVVGAAAGFNPDAIVQMGADSAYLDFNLIDYLVSRYIDFAGKYDYVCNDFRRDFPIGTYGHIVKFSKLKEINSKTDVTIKEREDVVRYFWNHSQNYKLLNISSNDFYLHPALRLTIDYPEDLILIKNALSELKNDLFTFNDLITLKNAKPDLFKIVEPLVQLTLPNTSGIDFDEEKMAGDFR